MGLYELLDCWACIVLGIGAMAYAFRHYNLLTTATPETDYPKFTLVFGLGWILALTGALMLWMPGM